MTGKKTRRAELVVAFWFFVAIVASGVFTAGFALDAGIQVEGAGLGIACCAIAAALITWSRDLLDHEKVEDPQHPQRSQDDEREAALWLFEGGLKRVADRKAWLVRLGIAAATALGIAALFPLRTFGKSPKGRIGVSDWQRGRRLVLDDGTVVRRDMIREGSVITAFPEGFVGPDRLDNMANDAIVVMHVPLEQMHLPENRKDWTPEGFIAYSKICTHLGCPLGLYRAGAQQLMCPCHQSTFNVLDGGQVVFGPAARSLPQLPLTLDSDGTLRAADGFSDFVGPDNWDYGV